MIRYIIHRSTRAPLIKRGIKGVILILLPLLLFAEGVFVDDLGNELHLSSTPGRIISLAPSITEMLFAVGAGDRVVGVTDFCDYPDEAKKKERVGGFVNPNIEKILSLHPDIVFATKDGNDPRIVKRIKSAGIPVYVTNPRDLEGILKDIIQISRILRVEDRGNAIVDDIKRRLAKIKGDLKHLPGKRVIFLYGLNPIIASGKGTFAHDLIQLAGGVNALGDVDISYPRIGPEEIIARNPDVIILSTMSGESEGEIKKLEEMVGKKIYRISGDLVNRPGPRIIDGIETLYGIIRESK